MALSQHAPAPVAAPSRALAANDYRLLADALQRSCRAGAFSPEEIDVHRNAWRQDRALTALVPRHSPGHSARDERRISLPVLVVRRP